MPVRKLPRIFFHYLVPNFYFPNRTKLKRFIELQLRKEGKSIHILNIIFCSDNYLLSLNQSHLNHDTLTDIITFEYSSGKEALVSDVYISIERVKDNAVHFHASFLTELHRVIFHGALHLCGYGDKKPADIKMMRKMEDVWLKKYL